MKKWIVSLLMVCGAAWAAPTNVGMYATLQTTMGDVCFELYYTNAPQTVANFVSLAEGTRPWIDPRTSFVSTEPYYNGLTFHRVIDGFMIQGGSPKGDGTDGPGYTFQDEFDPALRHDRPGIVSMANSGPDSNGGQFFITVTNTTWLDDVHTVFGFVEEGMEVVSNIAAVATDTNDRPLVDITITNTFITRNGTNAQNFSATSQALPLVEALPLGIEQLNLTMGTTTASYQYVYSSTNLRDWVEGYSEYLPAADGIRELIATGESREYFHANRVVYPEDKNRTGSPVLHELVMTIGSDIFTITPDELNTGHVMVNAGTNSALTYWNWDPNPHRVQFIVNSDDYVPFGFNLYYTSPTNGLCDGYYDDGEWQFIGSGTFTAQDLN